MIVVSDTTPLNYLILIGRIDVLRDLYDQIVIPEAVLIEMQSPGTPETVVDWTRRMPDWIIVKRAPQSAIIAVGIEEGEAEAISLAKELRADLILLDDRRARKFAEARGLSVVGTLGVMVEAANRRLIDFGAALADLKRTNFRFSQRVLDAALEQVRESKT